MTKHSFCFAIALLCGAMTAWGQPPQQTPAQNAPPVVGGYAPLEPTLINPSYHVTGNDDHLKMVPNSSRFLILDRKIPQVQVNNPDILDVVPLSPNRVQISAKRTGVTQVNLWGDDKRIYTVNVIVVGDVAELTNLLRELYPRTTLTITPVNGTAVSIAGYVEQQEWAAKIVEVAKNYFPNVINSMIVSGTQQAVIHVKVVEVSRTKLRNMGFDWAYTSSTGNTVWSGVNSLLTTVSGTPFGAPGGAPDNLFKFNIGGLSAFYGVLNALREDDLGKILSEPDLTANSGQPASVSVGGELGYQVTNAISGTMVAFKEYGTRLDIVPVILGNGRMHIDVHALVSQPDAANSIGGIPALKKREVTTGVELRAGQTLAIAGLIEERIEAVNHGLPWISDVPYLGAAFRSVSHQTNEVELLVLLTPELVDGMEPGQVPTCLPGRNTTEPSDWELFFKGHLEVPNCCPAGAACQAGGPSEPACQPIRPQNVQNRANQNDVAANSLPPEPGFIGPIGYDVLK